MKFNELIVNFDSWKELLLKYQTDETYINVNDYNLIKDLIGDKFINSKNLTHSKSLIALYWKQLYAIYLKQKTFYDKTITELNNQITTTSNSLYEMGEQEVKNKIDLLSPTPIALNKYLSQISQVSGDLSKAFIDNIINYNLHLQNLKDNDPYLNLIKDFANKILLTLNPTNLKATNQVDIFDIQNGEVVNISSLNFDFRNKSIKNIAVGVNPNDAVNKSQIDGFAIEIAKNTSDINNLKTNELQSDTIKYIPKDIVYGQSDKYEAVGFWLQGKVPGIVNIDGVVLYNDVDSNTKNIAKNTTNITTNTTNIAKKLEPENLDTDYTFKKNKVGDKYQVEGLYIATETTEQVYNTSKVLLKDNVKAGTNIKIDPVVNNNGMTELTINATSTIPSGSWKQVFQADGRPLTQVQTKYIYFFEGTTEPFKFNIQNGDRVMFSILNDQASASFQYYNSFTYFDLPNYGTSSEAKSIPQIFKPQQENQLDKIGGLEVDKIVYSYYKESGDLNIELTPLSTGSFDNTKLGGKMRVRIYRYE